MSDTSTDPIALIAAALKVDKAEKCPYLGRAMEKAIELVMADPTLQTRFADMLTYSDYDGKNGVGTHEFAASLVAKAAGNAPEQIPKAGKSIFEVYETQWCGEHPGSCPTPIKKPPKHRS